MDRDAVLLGELDRPGVHHAGPQACQLEHLVIADAVDLAGFGDDPGVGGVHAVHVGVDLAGGGAEHRGQGDGRGIGAAAAQGRDVVILIHALEPGNDDDLALGEGLGHAVIGDVLDPRFGVKAVGHQADLGPGEADRGHPQALDGHGHERHAHLFAGGQEHVHLAGRRPVRDLPGQRDQLVGRVPPGRDHHQDLLTAMMSLDRPPRRRQNLVRVRNARPAEFLHKQRQRGQLPVSFLRASFVRK